MIQCENRSSVSIAFITPLMARRVHRSTKEEEAPPLATQAP